MTISFGAAFLVGVGFSLGSKITDHLYWSYYDFLVNRFVYSAKKKGKKK